MTKTNGYFAETAITETFNPEPRMNISLYL